MRKFPTPGFYEVKSGGFWYYVSGTTKGNYYMDPSFHGKGWHPLTWTCVPGLKRIATEFMYFTNNPTTEPLP